MSAVAVARAYKAGKAVGKQKGKKTQKQKDIRTFSKFPKRKMGKKKKQFRGMANGVGMVGAKYRRFTVPLARGAVVSAARDQRGVFEVGRNVPVSQAVVGNAATNTSWGIIDIINLNPGLVPDTSGSFSPSTTMTLSNGISQRLAQIAQLYESHSLNKKGCFFVLNYRSGCPDTIAGEIGITYVRSVKTPLPATRNQCLEQGFSTRFSNTFKTFSLKHGVDPGDMKLKRVRTGASITQPTNDGSSVAGLAADLDMYDYGYVIVWGDGVATSQKCGHLTASFRWYFEGPTSTSAGIGAIESVGGLAQHFQNNTSTTISSTGGSLSMVDATFSPFVKAGSTALVSLTAPVVNTINFLKTGLYQITAKMRFAQAGPTANSVNPGNATGNFLATGGASILSDWDDGFSVEETFTVNSASSTNLDGLLLTTVVNVGSLPATAKPTVALGNGWASGVSSTIQLLDVIIAEVPGAYTKLKAYQLKQQKKKEEKELVGKLSAEFKKLGWSANGVATSPRTPMSDAQKWLDGVDEKYVKISPLKKDDDKKDEKVKRSKSLEKVSK